MAYPSLLGFLRQFIQQDTPPLSISPYTTYEHNSSCDLSRPESLGKRPSDHSTPTPHQASVSLADILKYGILNMYADKEALPLALEHNVGIINMAVIRVKLPNPKLLQEQVATWKAAGRVAHDDLPDENPLGWLVHDDVKSVVDAGYKFAADHPAISTVLTGTSSIKHLDDNVRALENPILPDADKGRLHRVFGDLDEYI